MRRRRRSLSLALLTTCCACSGTPVGPSDPTPNGAPPANTSPAPSTTGRRSPTRACDRGAGRSGDVVRIADGPAFTIPSAWIEADEPDRPTLHLRPRSLVGVETKGEWDAESARVVDAVFDLQDLAFQGGSDGWGAQSVGYFDRTLRVYVVGSSEQAIERRLDGEGARALATVSQRLDGVALTDFRPRREVTDEWRHSRWAFSLHFDDYGGTAAIDVWLHGAGANTFAFVFMGYASDESDAEMRRILQSVRWGNS